MKKYMKILLPVMMVAVVITACQPDDIVDYKPREAGDVNSISGTWKGVSVIQQDNDAIKKNFPYKSMDITDVLDFTKVTLTLNTASGAPTTFDVNYNGAPAFFDFNSGDWRTDNMNKVKTVSLIKGTDTTHLVLGSYLFIEDGKLQLKLVKTLLGNEVITYEMNFSK